MKFYPHPILRVLRYMYIVVFIGLPLYLSTDTSGFVVAEDEHKLAALFVTFAVVEGIIVYFGLWEKLFPVLALTESEICWKCPLKMTRRIPVKKCVEIGAYVEFKDKGIPSEQIYFSDHPEPQKNMRKNGSMKASAHLIKFEFSHELCAYVLQTYPDSTTRCLREYYQQRKKY